jgi:hypothetical protein
MKTTIPAAEVIAGFSVERRGKIAARAKELIAAEMALGDISNPRALTQEHAAKKLGGKQAPASRAARM